MRRLAGLPIDQPNLTWQAQLWHRDGRELAAGDLGERTAAGEQRDAEPHLHSSLDPIETRQRNLDVERCMALLEQPKHPLARG